MIVLEDVVGWEGGTVLLERPWARIKTPVPIPDPADVDDLLTLPLEQLAELVRDHLLPRGQDPDARTRWERLWAALGADDRLADRTFDVLEDLLSTTEADLGSGRLEDADERRARKFLTSCDHAWSRLQGHDDRPLGWAGGRAARFNPPARHVLAQLVDAIAEHRRSVTEAKTVRGVDEELWRVLAAVRLDPEQMRSTRR